MSYSDYTLCINYADPSDSAGKARVRMAKPSNRHDPYKPPYKATGTTPISTLNLIAVTIATKGLTLIAVTIAISLLTL